MFKQKESEVKVSFIVSILFKGNYSYSFKTDRMYYPTPAELVTQVKVDADSYKIVGSHVDFYKKEQKVGRYNLDKIEGFHREEEKNG